jgi:hypothetical protein
MDPISARLRRKLRSWIRLRRDINAQLVRDVSQAIGETPCILFNSVSSKDRTNARHVYIIFAAYAATRRMMFGTSMSQYVQFELGKENQECSNSKRQGHTVEQ